jgi:sugar O-acyltransferase (sialic acid O-acetyltransferase NeuD family)
MNPQIVIWGASGHAKVVADIVTLCGEFQIVGFLDDINRHLHGTTVDGVKVLGGQEQLALVKSRGARHLVFGIGDACKRLKLATIVDNAGFRFATVVHPRACVARSVSVGDGTVVAAGAMVNPGVQIGRNAVINTSASVGHDCVIGEAVSIGPGAHLAGRVRVCDGAWIGIGAIVREDITVGAGSIIGAGTVLTRDIPEDVVAYGVPGRVIRRCDAQSSVFQTRAR